MTARDRTVLLVVGVLAAAGRASGFSWSRRSARRPAELTGKVAAAQTRLSTAQLGAAAAEKARSSYAADYATVARLGKAVTGRRRRPVAGLPAAVDRRALPDRLPRHDERVGERRRAAAAELARRPARSPPAAVGAAAQDASEEQGRRPPRLPLRRRPRPTRRRPRRASRRCRSPSPSRARSSTWSASCAPSTASPSSTASRSPSAAGC